MRTIITLAGVLGLVLTGVSPLAYGEDPAPAEDDSARLTDQAGDRGERRRPGRARRGRGPARFLLRALDRDGDGKVTRDEMKAFFHDTDVDGDGALGPEEIGNALRRSFDGARRRPQDDSRGEAERRRAEPAERANSARPEAVEKDPASLAAARTLREAREREDLPEAGDTAPDFRLKLLEASRRPEEVGPDGEGRVRLSDYRGKKPVVLIFGSYT